MIYKKDSGGRFYRLYQGQSLAQLGLEHQLELQLVPLSAGFGIRWARQVSCLKTAYQCEAIVSPVHLGTLGRWK